jgi:hypothetical protein
MACPRRGRIDRVHSIAIIVGRLQKDVSDVYVYLLTVDSPLFIPVLEETSLNPSPQLDWGIGSCRIDRLSVDRL